MKTKKGFELRDVCGEKVIIASGIENMDFSHLIALNETAAFLWENIQESPSFEEKDLVEILLNTYDVDGKQAWADVSELLSVWKAQGLLEE